MPTNQERIEQAAHLLTEAQATLAAIDGLFDGVSGKLAIVLGGEGKGQDFAPLAEP